MALPNEQPNRILHQFDSAGAGSGQKLKGQKSLVTHQVASVTLSHLSQSFTAGNLLLFALNDTVDSTGCYSLLQASLA